MSIKEEVYEAQTIIIKAKLFYLNADFSKSLEVMQQFKEMLWAADTMMIAYEEKQVKEMK